MPAASIVWDFTLINARLHELSIITVERMLIIANGIADDLEQYMQDNAPWEDQTGDARDGLGVDLSEESEGLVLTLYHTVEYGIWLEVRYSGEFAIILPTIESQGPEMMSRFHGLFGEL